MQHVVTLFLAALFFCGIQPRAGAASFTIDEFGTSLTLNGEILPGDAERFAMLFVSVKPSIPGFYNFPDTLYLNSPGGDVAEAIRIGDLVRVLGLSVATMPNGSGICASSCFLIYVAALQRRATGVDTLASEGSKGNLSPIGVHRPRFRVPVDGIVGADNQQQIMNHMRDHLVRHGVGHAIIDKMMAKPSNDIHWLSAGEIRSLGYFSPGVEEQIIAKCGYNSRRDEGLSARDYINSLKSGVLACVREYMSAAYEPLRDSTVEKMRKGWRPWPH
jgi:hypothetical protein